MPKLTASSPVPIGLNPAFLAQHEVVLVEISEGKLTVAMRDCGNERAIDALRFATDLEIAVVPMSRAFAATHHPSRASTTLLDQAMSRAGLRCRAESVLAPLALLLEAGYTPAEAGAVLQSVPHLDADVYPLARRLAAGDPLATVLADASFLPWLAGIFPGWTGRDGDAEALVVALARPGPLAEARRSALRIAGECLLLGLPAAIAWLSLSPSAAPVMSALAVLLVAALHQIVARKADNDFVRAEVLDLIATLAGLHAAPAAAIRAGLARLEAIAGQAGCSEGAPRPALADALALSGLSAALLMHGDLAAAARRTSGYCIDAAERRMAGLAWLSRFMLFASLGVALVLIVS